MDGSKLNRRIQIQQQTTSQDVTGAPVQAWTPVYFGVPSTFDGNTCWANVDVHRGQLVYETAEFVSKTTHQITMRWTSQAVIEPNMRILYVEPGTGVTHLYNIEALMNKDQANIWLVALCYELNGAE